MINNPIDLTIPDHNGQNIWKEDDRMNQINLELKPRLNESINDLDPYILNPETCIIEDIIFHAKTEQYLSDNTINKRITYLRFMERHTYPIDMRNPDEREFIRHIRYRLLHENPPASTHVLRHERLAINMVRSAYGMSPIHLKLPPTPEHKTLVLPLPDTVRKLWHTEYSKDRKISRLYQYMFRLSFLIGMRMPSEMCLLTTDDVYFNDNGTAILTITEAKKRNSKRTVMLPESIATDPRQKTIKNWIESWRPKIAKPDVNALFTTPKGDAWTPGNLAKYLRLNGKKVWPHYHPYVSRHWSAVARLIDQFETYNHWNVYAVKNWHGHDKIKSTEKYIKYAEQYYNIAKYNWLKRVLKAPYLGEENTLRSTNVLETPASSGTLRSERYGRGHKWTVFSLEKCQQIDDGGVTRFIQPSYFFSIFHNGWERFKNESIILSFQSHHYCSPIPLLSHESNSSGLHSFYHPIPLFHISPDDYTNKGSIASLSCPLDNHTAFASFTVNEHYINPSRCVVDCSSSLTGLRDTFFAWDSQNTSIEVIG